jgi:putative DNA-invertase from lambdoid prophage Rac
LLRRRPKQEQGLAGRLPGRVQLGQRAALYCRVSTADQSCARQERDLAAFAGRAGYEVVGVFKEIGSGAKLDRIERRRVMALAQRREIDAVLVTELSRWGRSTLDLLHTLKQLETWRVSVLAMNGLAFDLATPHGRMLATIIAGIAEFERELVQERVRSGLATAKARGKRLGRQPGQRPKSDRLAPKVLALVGAGRSYRLIGRELGLSKNTVVEIVKRARATGA